MCYYIYMLYIIYINIYIKYVYINEYIFNIYSLRVQYGAYGASGAMN